MFFWGVKDKKKEDKIETTKNEKQRQKPEKEYEHKERKKRTLRNHAGRLGTIYSAFPNVSEGTLAAEILVVASSSRKRSRINRRRTGLQVE